MEIYHDFVRANSEYFGIADAAGLDITANLTLGCWVYFDAESTDVVTGIMSKWYETGNQRAFVIYKSAANKIVFSVSVDGSAVISVDDLGASYVVGQWFYVVGRYTPSEELALFVNGMWYQNITSIPASLMNSSEPFELGRYNRTNYLDGRMSQSFLCAYSVPSRFICSMFSHAKALYMNRSQYQHICSSSSSSTSTSSSSSSSTTTSSSSSVIP